MTGSLQTCFPDIPFNPTCFALFMEDSSDGNFKPPFKPSSSGRQSDAPGGGGQSNQSALSDWGSPDASNRYTPMSFYSSTESPNNPSSTPDQSFCSPLLEFQQQQTLPQQGTTRQTTESSISSIFSSQSSVTPGENPLFHSAPDWQSPLQEPEYHLLEELCTDPTSINKSTKHSDKSTSQSSHWQVHSFPPPQYPTAQYSGHDSLSSSGLQQLPSNSSSSNISPFVGHLPSHGYDISYSLNVPPSPSTNSRSSNLQTFPSVSQTTLSHNDAFSSNVSTQNLASQERASHFVSSSLFTEFQNPQFSDKTLLQDVEREISHQGELFAPSVSTVEESASPVFKEWPSSNLKGTNEQKNEVVSRFLFSSEQVPLTPLTHFESTSTAYDDCSTSKIPSPSFGQVISGKNSFNVCFDTSQTQPQRPSSKDQPTYQELHPFSLGESAWSNIEAGRHEVKDWSSMEVLPRAPLFSPGSLEVWQNISERPTSSSNSPSRRRSVSRSPLSVAGVEGEFSSNSSSSSLSSAIGVRLRKNISGRRKEALSYLKLTKKHSSAEGQLSQNPKQWASLAVTAVALSGAPAEAGTSGQRKQRQTERKGERELGSEWQCNNSPVNMETESGETSPEREDNSVKGKTSPVYGVNESSDPLSHPATPSQRTSISASITEERSDEEDNRIRLTSGKFVAIFFEWVANARAWL